ncbi:hypothetical protein [Porphyromonas cangingivalis]|uniref:hypothetical protein n=1 Tax=Porphyromonas cangingivalis TaxID=36874 RepID=UPI00136451BF|nr:hypothetical protein [Porphyromonas cangingivalis]
MFPVSSRMISHDGLYHPLLSVIARLNRDIMIISVVSLDGFRQYAIGTVGTYFFGRQDCPPDIV